MVISVFPDYGQAIDRYRSVRGERLERQAQQAQQQVFNRMLQGIEDPQQRGMVEAMGAERGPAAAYEMQRADQERQAASLTAMREQQREFLVGEGERYAQWQSENPDAEDDLAFIRSARIRADSLGIPVRDNDALASNIRAFGTGVERPREPQGTEFERLISHLPGDQQASLREARALRLANGDSEQAINIDLQGVLSDAQLGSIAQTGVESANEAISVNRQLLGLLDDFDAQRALTGEGSAGLLAYLRESGQGVLSQLEGLANFGPAGQQIAALAAEAQNPANWESDANPSEFFNPELGGLSFLKNTIAYAVARANDPGARLSDADVRQARNSLGFGPTSSDEQINSVFRVIRRRSQRSIENAIADRDSYLGRGRPAEQETQSEAPKRSDFDSEDAFTDALIEFYANANP